MNTDVIRICLFSFPLRTIFIMSSIVIKNEKKKKERERETREIDKSWVLTKGEIVREFSVRFFYILHSVLDHSRHTFGIGWLAYECRTFFFFPSEQQVEIRVSVYKDMTRRLRGMFCIEFVADVMRYQLVYLRKRERERSFMKKWGEKQKIYLDIYKYV